MDAKNDILMFKNELEEQFMTLVEQRVPIKWNIDKHVGNMEVSIVISELSETYQIDNWLTCDNLLELVYQTHPELEGIDLYFNDKKGF